MAYFAEDQDEKEKLVEMAMQDKNGLELYYEYVVREKRDVSEILFDF